jgi:serine/threonine protein kinase
VHTNKFNALCRYLDPFRVTLLRIDFQNRSVNPTEQSDLEGLRSLLIDLKSYFLGFTRDNFVQKVVEFSVQSTNEYLAAFVSEFNSAVGRLKLSEFHPVGLVDAQNEPEAHSEDLQNLTEKLTVLANDVSYGAGIRERLVELERLAAEVSALRRRQREQEDNLKRIISDQEVEEALQEFSPYFLKHADFVRDEDRRIGSGAFSDVYRGLQKSTNREVAIKKLRESHFTRRDLELFRREVKILSQLQHFAILPFIGVCVSNPYQIITEYMVGGSLYSWLRQDRGHLDPTQLTIIAIGVACGLSYMHSRNLLHRDIKSANVLLDSDGCPRICDFGMSRWQDGNDSPLTVGVGTSQWMAPEILNDQSYNEKADVYSYGMLLWEMMTRDIPFRGMLGVKIALAVAQDAARPLMPQDAPPSLANLIERCWSQDPEGRPDLSSIIRAFASGEIGFPGADHSLVLAYIQRDGELHTHDSPAAILEALNTKPEDGLALLKGLPRTDDYSEFYHGSELIEALVRAATRCKSRRLADDLIRGITEIVADDESLAKFIGANGPASVLKLISKFGIASVPAVLDYLEIASKANSVKLGAKHFTKLSSLLMAAEPARRARVIVVFEQIVTNHGFRKGEDLNAILPNLLAVLLPDGIQELVGPVLRLLRIMVAIPGVRSNDISESVGQLLASPPSDPAIVESALLCLRVFLTASPPTAGFASQLLPCLPGFFPLAPIPTLAVIALLLRSPLACAEVARSAMSDSPLVSSLAGLLGTNDRSVLICTLKLFLALASDPTTAPPFTRLTSSIVNRFLSSESAQIATLAGAIATVHLLRVKTPLTPDPLLRFLRFNLDPARALAPIALRICGSLACSLPGTLFLCDHSILDRVSSFLDGPQRPLALHVFASASAFNPLSPFLIAATPTFFDAIESASRETAWIFLANIAVHPQGALDCARRLGTVTAALANADADGTFRILTLLSRVVSCEEARPVIDDPTILSEVVQATRPLWAGEHCEIIFHICEALSTLKRGRKALRNAGFAAFAVGRDGSNASRAALLRTVARLGRRKFQAGDPRIT